MRFSSTFCIAFYSFFSLLAVGCSAESSAESQLAKPLAAAETLSNAEAPATSLDTPEKPKLATVSKPQKPKFAPLGMCKDPNESKRPTFAAMGSTLSVGVNTKERAVEVKRLIGMHQTRVNHYCDSLIRATTPEEKEALANRAPTVHMLRPIVTLLVHKVAAYPEDEPALDALVFLSKYIGIPEIDKALAGGGDEASKIDPLALLLEYHADNPKIIDAARGLQKGETTDIFLANLFNKTFNPEIRWAVGAQLFASLRRNNQPKEIREQLIVAMSEDRYLESVEVGRSNARDWALNKLQELRTLGIGKVMPELFGNKLEGGIGNIADYRGKVVVVDVWNTRCGPCVRMIPHVVDMTDRLKDKPFAFLSVSCDKDQEMLEKFLEETPMPWDHWWVSRDSEFKKTLNISAYPTVFVLDSKGVIRYKNIRDDKLEEAVNSLLEEIDPSEPEPQS